MSSNILKKENVDLFFQKTSIRGFSRIVNKDSDTAIRCMWLTFVVTTTLALVFSSFKIVTDYLQYSVNIQTSEKLDDKFAFPDVTFCNHQPFSERAFALWRKGNVMSPTEFNRKLRIMGNSTFQSLLKQGNVEMAARYGVLYSVYFDSLKYYYQTLAPDVAEQLGHDKTVIRNCMWLYSNTLGFGNMCKDDMWRVERFSHRDFFNCYTIRARRKEVTDITQLGFIVYLGPTEEMGSRYRQGFLMDLYAQAFGLRVVIHEGGTIPRISEDGIQIEPGKMNEINFQSVRFKKVKATT